MSVANPGVETRAIARGSNKVILVQSYLDNDPDVGTVAYAVQALDGIDDREKIPSLFPFLTTSPKLRAPGGLVFVCRDLSVDCNMQ